LCIGRPLNTDLPAAHTKLFFALNARASFVADVYNYVNHDNLMNTKGSKRMGRPHIRIPDPVTFPELAGPSETPAPEPSIPLSFRLPKSLAEDLDRFDREHGDHRRLSDRARTRLARSLSEDRQRENEPQLYALLREIVEIAHMVERRRGVEKWHADRDATKIFAAAIAYQILSHNAQAGNALTEQELEQGRREAEIFREVQRELTREVRGLLKEYGFMEGRSTKKRGKGNE
jgi:hypothetical protein